MTPVVMLTALTAVENKVTCLDAGADDYLGKPLTAGSCWPVSGQPAATGPIESWWCCGTGIWCTTPRRCCWPVAGRRSRSQKLGLMIELFMKSKGQALARATLFARVWGADADVEEAILDNYIGFFRRRLAEIHSR